MPVQFNTISPEHVKLKSYVLIFYIFTAVET